MCNGRCQHFESEYQKREEIAKRLMILILALDRDMNAEEFTEIRLKMISLINDMM